jgi:hypothetical protein
MSTPQFLTDEQAAAIWAGDTASILNFDGGAPQTTDTTADPVETPDPNADPATTDPKPNMITDEDINNVWVEDGKEEDEEDSANPPAPTNADPAPANPSEQDSSKRGRKASDLVNMVNQLVQEEVLFGYEDDKGSVAEVKTIEEAKELIRENLKYKEDSAVDIAWKKKVETYSPQVQAILHYAEKGGQDVAPLLHAIAEVEKSSEINPEEESGQEEIVRQVLKIKGFDDEEIKDQIDTLKDLDRLKAKATKFLPELNKMKEQRIQMILQEQEQRDLQAKEAAQIYLQTVQQTLDKEQVGPLKLQREDKFKIVEALADAKYKSISGYKVNEFVKSLEELQFGKNSNYEHFLNIVHFAIDKDGFIERLKDTIKSEVAGETVKRLKTAKTSNPNSGQDNNTTSSDSTRKNVIPKSGFKNPYSK